MINKRYQKLPPDFVGYFGTMGRAGHDLYVLEGNIDTESIFEWAGEFDQDWILLNLDITGFKVFWWEWADVTILGYPRSLDDSRPGSKSLFIVKGNYTSDYSSLLNKMKQYPGICDIFKKLAKKINI